MLPFDNATANPDTEYLSEGITESIIRNLSTVPRLRVVPRSMVFRYKGRNPDPQKAGRNSMPAPSSPAESWSAEAT